MSRIALLDHFTCVLTHHHGDLIKSICTKDLVAGSTQLVAGHRFHVMLFSVSSKVQKWLLIITSLGHQLLSKCSSFSLAMEWPPPKATCKKLLWRHTRGSRSSN